MKRTLTITGLLIALVATLAVPASAAPKHLKIYQADTIQLITVNRAVVPCNAEGATMWANHAPTVEGCTPRVYGKVVITGWNNPPWYSFTFSWTAYGFAPPEVGEYAGIQWECTDIYGNHRWGRDIRLVE